MTSAFQSSPDPKAGRNVITVVDMAVQTVTFQSSPDPKAGRNTLAYKIKAGACKFQSSPDPKAGRNVPFAG